MDLVSHERSRLRKNELMAKKRHSMAAVTIVWELPLSSQSRNQGWTNSEHERRETRSINDEAAELKIYESMVVRKIATMEISTSEFVQMRKLWIEL